MHPHFKTVICSAFLMFTVFHCQESHAQELIRVYFPPDYLKKDIPSESISSVFSAGLHLEAKVSILSSYGELADAVNKSERFLVYAGSFPQAVFYARGRVTPFLQGIDGKEIYHASLLTRKELGSNAIQIVAAAGPNVAFALGSSGGELAAKVATKGKASIGLGGQKDAARDVQLGKVTCAFVKNVWWDHANHLFPDLQLLEYPELSEIQHFGNLLSASNEVSPEQLTVIKHILTNNPALFNVKKFVEVKASVLESTLGLMPRAGIDPKSYKW